MMADWKDGRVEETPVEVQTFVEEEISIVEEERIDEDPVVEEQVEEEPDEEEEGIESYSIWTDRDLGHEYHQYTRRLAEKKGCCQGQQQE
jgi:hypothetical protein